MRTVDAERLLGRTIHELAQPCASAALAVDTALELARRGRSADVIVRLEAAAEALGVLQSKLREAGDAARGIAARAQRS